MCKILENFGEERMEGPVKDNLLRSWKEIAAHLGVDERTCSRWEKRFGMPVHRAEGGASKSRVFAYRHELDGWFKTTFTNGHQRPALSLAGAKRKLRWAAVGFLIVVIAASYFAVRGMIPSGQPADFAIRDSSLIILDEKGRELWKRNTGMEELQTEARYKEHCRTPVFNGEARSAYLVIKDLDGDGNNETLFTPKSVYDQTGEGTLVCYDSRGVERWRFEAGREMTFGGKLYSPDYRIAGIWVHDFNGDGRMELAVVSVHAPQWPCQLATLDNSGRLTGEFWNSGYISDLAFRDINRDGIEEILAGGVNNEYGAFLSVFAPGRVGGASPQTGEYRAEGVPAGTELHYVIFPRTDVSLALGEMGEGFTRVEVTKNNRIRLTSGPGVIFEIDFVMRCLSVDWSHGFIQKHNGLRAAGKIRSSLDDAYRELLKGGIRRWNGSGWAPEASGDSGPTGRIP